MKTVKERIEEFAPEVEDTGLTYPSDAICIIERKSFLAGYDLAIETLRSHQAQKHYGDPACNPENPDEWADWLEHQK